MKKPVFLMLSLTLLFTISTAPVSASAATYVTAKDNEFAGTKNGEFSYYGDDAYVKIPNTIKGVAITSYDFMFANTEYVKGVISDNPNIVSTVGMFANNKSDTLTVDIDTSSVKNMTAMFERAKTKTINLSGRFDTSKVKDFAFMFAWTDVSNLDLSSWDTSNATCMYSMFQNSKVTNLKLNFNTSKVEQMDNMFYKSRVQSLDLSSFKFIRGAVIDYMFDDAAATVVYVKNQQDADRLDATIKPKGLLFEVK